jgi:hypothetical protein
LTLSTSQHADAPTAVEPHGPDAPGPTQDGGGGLFGLGAWPIYSLFILGGLVLGAVTLLVPSTPSYDPWCWIDWGREILHGSLHTQGGATWKPLPVIFTTIFALFGKAQPDLWLVVARAGFVVTILMSGKLAARLTLGLAPGSGHQPLSSLALIDRLGRVGPAVLAAIVAMLAVTFSGGWLSNSTLGYSEALAVAFILIGFERHIDGHYRQAFACGLVAALDRPETWLFWGPYGLWLMWKDPGARALVVGLALLTIVVWFVPQKLGGGSFTSGVSRATHVRANSNALASFPFWAEFKAAWTLSIFRIKVAAITMIAGGLTLLGYHWRTHRRPTARLRLNPLQVRTIAFGTVCGLFGFGWWALIALETQAGFSGNSRYLTIGAASVDIAGAICYGTVALLIGQLPRLWVPENRERLKLGQRLVLGTVLLAAWFIAFPNWVGSNFISLGAFHKAISYQAGLRRDVSALIKREGGVKALQSCGAGHIMIEGFQVPMLAWYLNERTANIEDQPTTNQAGVSLPLNRPWPNVIMQDRDTGGATLLPTFQTIHAWEQQGAHYRVVTTKEIRFFEDCSAQSNDTQASTSS